jgi:hypothetical protein
VLVIDPLFTGPLGLVAQVSLLRDHGVEKIHHLVDADLVTESKNVLYLVRPKVENMKMIARQGTTVLRFRTLNDPFNLVRKLKEQNAKKVLQLCVVVCLNLSTLQEYSLFFVPRRTMICERVLEDAGVYSDISIGEYQLDLIPLEDDVLTLAMGSAYKECFLEVRRRFALCEC